MSKVIARYLVEVLDNGEMHWQHAEHLFPCEEEMELNWNEPEDYRGLTLDDIFKETNELDYPVVRRVSGRIGQALDFLRNVRNSIKELDTATFRDLYELGAIHLQPIFKEALAKAAEFNEISYTSVQDKITRQMGISMDAWYGLVERWLIYPSNNGNAPAYAEVKKLLLAHIPQRYDCNDAELIEEFFAEEDAEFEDAEFEEEDSENNADETPETE